MTYLRRVPGSTITRRTLEDPVTVPFRTAGLRWNQPVIVCWIRRTGIIIVRPPKHQQAPHNLPPDNTAAVPWKPGATKAELWKA